jgi:hypothetical protein
LSTWFGRRDGINSSTVPGMVVLGRSEILAVSKLSSAILADFDMRGSAISVWTASIVLLGSFWVCYCSWPQWSPKTGQ